ASSPTCTTGVVQTAEARSRASNNPPICPRKAAPPAPSAPFGRSWGGWCAPCESPLDRGRQGDGGAAKGLPMKLQRRLLSVLSVVSVIVAWTARAEAATTLASGGACWSSDISSPVTLVSNDQGRLTWDTYGNLTLENYTGGGTKQVWGIGSSTPLTGS